MTARGKAAEATEEVAAEATPEITEEPARPAPPPPPRPQARLAMPWSAISIATVAGGLLGAGLVYGLGNWLPLPDQRPVIADPAARLDATDTSLGEIETRLAAIEEQSKRTQVSLDATIAQLDGGLNEVRQSIAALPAAAAPVDLTPLETQLKSLEDRVTAIGAGASSADATALAQTISTIEAGIAELRTQLTALDQRVGTTDSAITSLKDEVAATQTAISTQNQTIGGADIGPAVRLPLVVSGLESAIGNGRPFAAELAGLKALLPDLAVPGEIEAAATEGLPRPDAVVARFTAEVPNVLAGRAAVSSGDMGEDALEWMKGLLALRPVGEVPGDTPEAIVSRLEAAVGRHDFKAAAELLAQLPPAMQAGAG
ncbi:COG4223 family protein, partial [Sphingomonas sp.]|uniref:COG4223 family protein n=1 Tax=Sphingomonas sp. TaxID=28214 RepID=UPI002FC8E47A